MDLEKGKTIAESLEPTFENVTREFITNTMYKIFFSDKLPNFKFEFREEEAIIFIRKTLENYIHQYEWHTEKAQKIMKKINEKSDKNSLQPVMIVNDYKKFFELLRQFYERDIELFFLRTEMTGFPEYEKDNCFQEIWLRATPDDFNNPEEFLKKQVDMIKDRTFEKYDKETYLGRCSLLDNNIISVKNGIARTWDENSREFEIKIYEKESFSKDTETQVTDKTCYELPVIRYGIYEKNHEKICYIGSIQNKNDNYEKSDFQKKMDRKKYKVNSNVPQEEMSQIEPKNLMTLSIFINLLNIEGITQFEVPSIYVLDYEYHVKRNKVILENFLEFWTPEEREKRPGVYEKSLYCFKKAYKKEDLISQIKTERLLLLFKRVLYHYPKGNIISYPGELDSFMHLNIPVVKNENEIKGDILKELYILTKEKNFDFENNCR